jgi:hypothetical protein
MSAVSAEAEKATHRASVVGAFIMLWSSLRFSDFLSARLGARTEASSRQLS